MVPQNIFAQRMQPVGDPRQFPGFGEPPVINPAQPTPPIAVNPPAPVGPAQPIGGPAPYQPIAPMQPVGGPRPWQPPQAPVSPIDPRIGIQNALRQRLGIQ
jgi:hypothetical protein